MLVYDGQYELSGTQDRCGGAASSGGESLGLTRISAPKNVIQLRSYLRMPNYYNKFYSAISHVLAPLYLLLRKNTP